MSFIIYSMFYVVIDHFESLSGKFPDRFAGRRFQMHNICFESLSHFNSETCQAKNGFLG